MQTNITNNDAARDAGQNLNTTFTSRIYRRETIGTLPPAKDHSRVYSRAQARSIFERFPGVNIVEYVSTGNKTDSQIIGRGDNNAPQGCFVIICSTGGKWGKSRRDFAPAN